MIGVRVGKWLGTCAGLTLLFLMVGCSSVTTREAMSVVVDEKSATWLAQSTAVTVGGEPRSVNIENFEAALVESLLAAGLFREVDNSGAAPYMLSVDFQQVDFPMFGGSFTIDIETTWKIFDNSDRSLLVSETVASSYSGGFEGGFIGVNRARVATEGAARENIRLGLEKLRLLQPLDAAEPNLSSALD